jgi:hypothetical protein
VWHMWNLSRVSSNPTIFSESPQLLSAVCCIWSVPPGRRFRFSFLNVLRPEPEQSELTACIGLLTG